MNISRGVRAPKSEKRYTTPRSDFRFALKPVTVARPRWICTSFHESYARILLPNPVRRCQVGAPDDLSALCGTVRACALLIAPFRSALLHFAYRSRNWRKQCQLLEVRWKRSEEDPADHLRFLRAWIARPFFHWSALDRGDLTVLNVGNKKVISSEHV